MTGLAVTLSCIALAVAVVALALTALLMRQNGETTTDLRAHRRAHAEAHGHPDPRLDRRQVNLGAPRSTGERRRQRVDEDTAHDAPVLTAPEVTIAGATAADVAEVTHRIERWGSHTAVPQHVIDSTVDVPPGTVRVVDAAGATVWEGQPEPEPRTVELPRVRPSGTSETRT